jgi:arylsulfatase
VVLITLDALRPDHLGCYGYPVNTSPNIDAFAKEGAAFTNAFAQASFTAPALASLMVSRYPSSGGVFDFGDTIPEGIETLTSLLKKNNFATGFFSSHTGLATIKGFEQSFDDFYTIWTFSENKKLTVKAADINPRIMKWLDAHKRKKFFIWIHYLEPHYPLAPAAKYRSLIASQFKGKKPVEVPISADYQYGFGGIPGRLAAAYNNRTDLNFYLELYDASIRYADSQVGEVLRCLKKLGLYDNSLIILSADHAESLGEHGQYFSHGFLLYDELLRVPLVIKAARAGTPGEKVQALAQHIDIAPTIADFLGIPQPKSMIGESLLPGLRNGFDRNNSRSFSALSPDVAAIRADGWKLIYDHRKGYELYDLQVDPGELNNLVSINREKFELLKNELDLFRKPPPRAEKKPLTIQEKEQLRSLGYAQ